MLGFSFSVQSYPTRAEMGKAAADETARLMKKLLDEKKQITMIFAAAPSQNEMLQALAAHTELDWSRVTALHMDEYVGLTEGAEQTFSSYLKQHIFDLLPFGEVHYIRGYSDDPEAECKRYTELFRKNPIDIVCMGIGENGHIAFNDPPVADLKDPLVIKQVELDGVCRMQQVHDGCFPTLDDVPTHALTLTVSALMSAKHHICVVPAKSKAQAVYNTVYGPIGEATPATALRLSHDAKLYLDEDSAALL